MSELQRRGRSEREQTVGRREATGGVWESWRGWICFAQRESASRKPSCLNQGWRQAAAGTWRKRGQAMEPLWSAGKATSRPVSEPGHWQWPTAAGRKVATCARARLVPATRARMVKRLNQPVAEARSEWPRYKLRSTWPR